jgi:hypothetical protein
MSNLNQEQYNEELVFYCKGCLSLRIKYVAAVNNLEYCDECGATDIAQAHIEEWRRMYKERYGIDYLEK